MTYTAEQLRERARNLRANGHPMGAHECEAHADALEELAALREQLEGLKRIERECERLARSDAMQSEVRHKVEMENATLREQLAERDAEIAALKGHADLMAYGKGTAAINAMAAYRAAYPKEIDA